MQARLGIALCVAAQALCSAAAGARPLEEELPPSRTACWERRYDEAHLAAHPHQKVARIRLVHLPDTWRAEPSRGIYVALYINLRRRLNAGAGFDYQLGGFCRPRGQGLHCVPEWEAGSWRLEWGPQGTLDIRNGDLVANPNPYDAEEIADGAVPIPARPDDRVWRLRPATDECGIE